MSRIATAFLVSLCVAGSAAALPPRTFVASTGSDSNTCGRLDPCRTFNVALGAVASGGEVVALDSAGYGPFSATQPVAVVAPPGVHAAIAATSGDAVDINVIGSVVLRGLYINTPGGAFSGVGVVGVTSLNIENCVINGFSIGVNDSSSGSNLVIADTTIRNITSAYGGVVVGVPGGAAMHVLIDHTRVEYCAGSGVLAIQGALVVVRDSVASHSTSGFAVASASFFGAPGTATLTCERCTAEFNSNDGYVSGGDSPAAMMTLTDSVAAENDSGIVGTAGTGIVHISRCSIVHNTTGVGANVYSRGDNTFADNGTDGAVISFTAK